MLTQIRYSQSNSTALAKESSFLEQVETIRQRAVLSLDPLRRNSFGQYFTPLPIAQMMASMFQTRRKTVHLFDAGAGAGVLVAGFIDAVCKRKEKPTEIIVTVYELDENLLPFLSRTLGCCQELCVTNGIEFSADVRNEDFILAADDLSPGLFAAENKNKYDLAILNPPYGKINTDSVISRALRQCGITTPNLYTAFLALAAELLAPDGEMVAITPRSFCNGTYFKSFRRYFTERMHFRRFHVFDSRQGNFDEDILQENIIFHAVKNASNQPESSKPSEVIISTGVGTEKAVKSQFKLKSDVLIKPDDEEMYIHLGADELNQDTEMQMRYFQCSLSDLGISVSTGKVVDFRVKDFLLNGTEAGAAPLIYPHNFRNGIVDYPLSHPKKFDAIRINSTTESLLIESGDYVLVKRFSAKEEKRRVTAAIFNPAVVKCEVVGFENHLNYFHSNGKSLEPNLARGLAVYLNSSLVDAYFRQFSGHTQVNAGDLRYLKYPTREELKKLGKHFNGHLPAQETIDTLIRELTTDE